MSIPPPSARPTSTVDHFPDPPSIPDNSRILDFLPAVQSCNFALFSRRCLRPILESTSALDSQPILRCIGIQHAGAGFVGRIMLDNSLAGIYVCDIDLVSHKDEFTSDATVTWPECWHPSLVDALRLSFTQEATVPPGDATVQLLFEVGINLATQYVKVDRHMERVLELWREEGLRVMDQLQLPEPGQQPICSVCGPLILDLCPHDTAARLAYLCGPLSYYSPPSPIDRIQQTTCQSRPSRRHVGPSKTRRSERIARKSPPQESSLPDSTTSRQTRGKGKGKQQQKRASSHNIDTVIQSTPHPSASAFAPQYVELMRERLSKSRLAITLLPVDFDAEQPPTPVLPPNDSSDKPKIVIYIKHVSRYDPHCIDYINADHSKGITRIPVLHMLWPEDGILLVYDPMLANGDAVAPVSSREGTIVPTAATDEMRYLNRLRDVLVEMTKLSGPDGWLKSDVLLGFANILSTRAIEHHEIPSAYTGLYMLDVDHVWINILSLLDLITHPHHRLSPILPGPEALVIAIDNCPRGKPAEIIRTLEAATWFGGLAISRETLEPPHFVHEVDLSEDHSSSTWAEGGANETNNINLRTIPGRHAIVAQLDSNTNMRLLVRIAVMERELLQILVTPLDSSTDSPSHSTNQANQVSSLLHDPSLGDHLRSSNTSGPYATHSSKIEAIEQVYAHHRDDFSSDRRFCEAARLLTEATTIAVTSTDYIPRIVTRFTSGSPEYGIFAQRDIPPRNHSSVANDEANRSDGDLRLRKGDVDTGCEVEGYYMVLVQLPGDQAYKDLFNEQSIFQDGPDCPSNLGLGPARLINHSCQPNCEWCDDLDVYWHLHGESEGQSRGHGSEDDGHRVYLYRTYLLGGMTGDEEVLISYGSDHFDREGMCLCAERCTMDPEVLKWGWYWDHQ